MPRSDHPSHGPGAEPPRPIGDRAAAAWAYLASSCPMMLASIHDPAGHVADLEADWRRRARSIVDQLSTDAPRWRGRPEIAGWPVEPLRGDDLVELVIDELVELWRPPPEPARRLDATSALLPTGDDPGGDRPTESEQWDWVLTHVGLAQERRVPLSTYLGPAYVELWEQIMRTHPRLAALYRPDPD